MKRKAVCKVAHRNHYNFTYCTMYIDKFLRKEALRFLWSRDYPYILLIFYFRKFYKFHLGGPEHVVGVVPLPVRVAVVVDHLVAVPLELVPQELVGRGIGLYIPELGT